MDKITATYSDDYVCELKRKKHGLYKYIGYDVNQWISINLNRSKLSNMSRYADHNLWLKKNYDQEKKKEMLKRNEDAKERYQMIIEYDYFSAEKKPKDLKKRDINRIEKVNIKKDKYFHLKTIFQFIVIILFICSPLFILSNKWNY